jgi:hypothetical protein
MTLKNDSQMSRNALPTPVHSAQTREWNRYVIGLQVVSDSTVSALSSLVQALDPSQICRDAFRAFYATYLNHRLDTLMTV